MCRIGKINTGPKSNFGTHRRVTSACTEKKSIGTINYHRKYQRKLEQQKRNFKASTSESKNEKTRNIQVVQRISIGKISIAIDSRKKSCKRSRNINAGGVFEFEWTNFHG